MQDYQLRCAVCGSAKEIQPDNLEELQSAKTNGIYVCTPCQAKIRYESDQNRM